MKAVIGSQSGPQVSFVGPFGVGKTTAVLTVCPRDVVTTEVKRSNAASRVAKHLKQTTTVGLEIGEWVAPDGQVVCVVGTPGQERFDVVRRSAMPRSSAVVLWLFGDHAHALEDAGLWVEFIGKEVPARKLVVAITRLTDEEALEPFREAISAVAGDVPLFAADPRDEESVSRVLSAAVDRASVRPVVG